MIHISRHIRRDWNALYEIPTLQYEISIYQLLLSQNKKY